MNKTEDLKVAKDPELLTSKNNKTYLKLTLVADTEDGAKWYDAVAFGGFAETLKKTITKGMDLRVYGDFTIKEYTKRDGSVGTGNNVIINKVTLEGGKTVDKFGGITTVNENTGDTQPF